MKYVGDAIKEHELSTGSTDSSKIVAIGMAAWGCIENNSSLENVSQFRFFLFSKQFRKL